MRHLIVLCLLALCVSAAHAQCPDIIRRGDTLFAPEAQTYQWLHDGNVIPNATQRFYLPPVDGDYTVRLHSLASEPLDYTPGPTLSTDYYGATCFSVVGTSQIEFRNYFDKPIGFIYAAAPGDGGLVTGWNPTWPVSHPQDRRIYRTNWQDFVGLRYWVFAIPQG